MSAQSAGAGTEPRTARWWRPMADGRLRCELCPRRCTLRDGQRGFCFVRARRGDEIVLTTYGRSSGLALDPIEKKPLAHVRPGSTILSLGTAGCNLACRYCQNWEISTSRDVDALAASASPAVLARAAGQEGAVGVALTYNDPVVFAEYAIDVAQACHEAGLLAVAVSAGWIEPAPGRELFAAVDAANIDLKGFTEDFYRRTTGARLADVLDTLVLVRSLGTWLEITTLLIPGRNDSDAEIAAQCAWIVAELGSEVPVHFSAFHPAHRMLDVPRTPASTLERAREIARDAGIAHVYLGNVRTRDGSSTRCAGCGALLVGREGYRVTDYRITPEGACPQCDRGVAGLWDPAGPPPAVGQWWPRRVDVGA
ncbi:AmmeMemoRadiSam system radical SAM enzyme [Actinomyces slackii]|uniref:Glycine radical enzyme activase, YjjW family n=1 Tax=Actinomyces slackii TaxID=52774 RepID=A0A3S5EMB6_9ACTO|nr:AmmeMemoRadiSam system radical SAM enzyme [Actinomyces slackii]VEG75506.1 glycine radical enzyme activase, YjjW family [Actinomyces slackii]